MKIEAVKVEMPDGCNVILGQTHFIKSVEDIYEIVVTSQPACRFGLAFCEASGPCLIRIEGNEQSLKELAAGIAQKVGSGHFFVLVLQEAFPISILNGIKSCPEVCSLFCATANPLQVIVAETDQGRGVLGVVDGFPPRGIEGEEDVAHRREFLRRIGYKR